MDQLDQLLFLCDEVIFLVFLSGRTVNELYLTENLAKRPPGFRRAYDILDIEKMVFLG